MKQKSDQVVSKKPRLWCEAITYIEKRITLSFGHTERIKCEDDVVTICHKLSEGNPGALNVMMQMLSGTAKIDPDAALGPFAHLLNLDTFGIYGSKIWILYKDICCENIVHTITVLRAVQLGFNGGESGYRGLFLRSC